MASKRNPESSEEKMARQTHSNMKNPNNDAFWKARGIDSRPSNWHEKVNAHKRDGALHHRADQAGHLSQDQRRKIGEDVEKIERAAKDVYGGDAQVYKDGSIRKGTNIPGSDVDTKIAVSTPATMEQRHDLQSELGKAFGNENVEQGENHDVVKGASGELDVLPSRANYYGDIEMDPPGLNPFHTNTKAASAVRNIKLDAQELGEKVKGKDVETKVLRVQQENKGIGLGELVDKTKARLNIDVISIDP